MKVGYIPPINQNEIAQQTEVLRQAGCESIFHSQEYNVMLNSFKSGDVLVVKSLRSLGKTTRHLILLVNLLTTKRTAFHSLEDDIYIDGGEIAHILSVFLESGTTWGSGRPKGVINSIKTIKKAQDMYAQKTCTKQEIAQKLGISKPTLYRYLKMNIHELI
jgi:DNA invertase Pin-like site-specific DNA recombinase